MYILKSCRFNKEKSLIFALKLVLMLGNDKIAHP